MRLLLATVDFPPIEGGISTLSLRLAQELAARGHEVAVLAPRLAAGNPQYADMTAFDAEQPMQVYRFGGYECGWMRLAPFLSAGLPLLSRCDAVLAMNITYGGVLGRIAKLRFGIPYIAFAYGYEFLKFDRPIAASILRALYRESSTTIAISRFTKATLENFGVAEKRVQVAYPGVAPPAVPNAERIETWRARLDLRGPLILSAGRFMPRKGQRQLIVAMPDVRAHVPDAQLVLAGRGPEFEACRSQVRALGLQNCIHLPGYCSPDDLAALYGLCDVFALPAGEAAGGQVEGFGLVFLEAGSYGKPVIGGRSGGVPEAIVDNETGLLVTPGDSGELARALVRLLSEPALAERLGAAGRARAQEFTWSRFGQAVEVSLRK